MAALIVIYMTVCSIPNILKTSVSTLAVGMNNYAAPVQVLAAGQKNGWWFVVCDLSSHSHTTPRLFHKPWRKMWEGLGNEAIIMLA